MQSHFLGMLPSDYISLAELPGAQPQLPGAGPPAVGGCWSYHRSSYLQPARSTVLLGPREQITSLAFALKRHQILWLARLLCVKYRCLTLPSMAFLPDEYTRVWVSLISWSLPLLVVKYSKLSFVTFQGHDLANLLILLSLSFLFGEIEMVLCYIIG